jgi:hypothetical protein
MTMEYLFYAMDIELPLWNYIPCLLSVFKIQKIAGDLNRSILFKHSGSVTTGQVRDLSRYFCGGQNI